MERAWVWPVPEPVDNGLGSPVLVEEANFLGFGFRGMLVDNMYSYAVYTCIVRSCKTARNVGGGKGWADACKGASGSPEVGIDSLFGVPAYMADWGVHAVRITDYGTPSSTFTFYVYKDRAEIGIDRQRCISQHCK